MGGLSDKIPPSPLPLLARNPQYRFDVRHPDKLLILEILEDTAQCRSAIGRPHHEGMDADRNDSGLTVGMRLGLPGQFGSSAASIAPYPL